MRPVERVRRRSALGRLPLRLVALLVVALTPSGSDAQTVWESPRLLSPHAVEGTGLYYVRFAALPGDGKGGFLTWSPSALPSGSSLRIGAAEGAGGVLAGFGGVDVSTPLAAGTDTRPVDFSWNAGAGLSVGEYLIVSVPVGLAAGRTWASGSVWLAPYVAVRAAMDLRLGDAAPADEFEVSPGLDVGLDASFDRARRVVLRFAASLGDRSALAVGAVVGRSP